MTQMAVPPIMYGRLRPQRSVDRSASEPTRGCMISPDKGPAMNTRDMSDLESPREIRYGDATRHSRTLVPNFSN